MWNHKCRDMGCHITSDRPSSSNICEQPDIFIHRTAIRWLFSPSWCCTTKSFKSPFFTILAFSLSIELVPCDWLSSYWTEQAKAWRGVSNRVILVISVVTHMHYWQSRCIKAQFLIKCLENNKQKVLSYTWHRQPNQDHVDFGLQKIPCPAASAGTETAFGNNIIHLIPRSGAEFPGKNELLHRKQMH